MSDFTDKRDKLVELLKAGYLEEEIIDDNMLEFDNEFQEEQLWKSIQDAERNPD